MDRDEWYRDRILWRAKQHDLFNKRCYDYSNLPDDFSYTIKEAIPEDIHPVLVFWESEQRWTVLGTKAICSYYDHNLVFSGADEINKQLSISPPPGASPKDVKVVTQFIKLESTGQLIWAPSGPELFALMNILQMFPLRCPG